MHLPTVKILETWRDHNEVREHEPSNREIIQKENRRSEIDREEVEEATRTIILGKASG